MEIPSPSSSAPNSSSSSISNNGLGVVGVVVASLPPPVPPKPPSVPPAAAQTNIPSYPTTFVQADTQSFKQMVQLLTGSAETAAKRHPPPKNHPAQPLNYRAKKPAFKLYERRPSMKNLKSISSPSPSSAAAAAAARSPLSPSILDFPSLALSPVTPLIPDPFNPNPNPNPNPSSAAAEEERAIAEKGFYLHPSPRPATPSPPRLLPLFPLTSPRDSSSSSSSSSSA